VVLTIRLAAAVLLLVLFTSSAARASSILIGEAASWTYDGTSGGCSACQAAVGFELLSATSLKVTFENTSTDWLAGVNLFTGLGFNTESQLGDVTLADQSIEGNKVWKLSDGVGSGSWDLGLASKNGVNNGLDNQSDAFDGGWVILSWSSPLPGLSGLTIDGSVAKFQGVATAGGAVHAIGTSVGSTVREEGGSVPENQGASVPEPAALLMLAAGAAASFKRLKARTKGQHR
jgi:PEP-CTERM motif